MKFDVSRTCKFGPEAFLTAYNQNVTQIFLDQPDFLREGEEMCMMVWLYK